MYGTYGTILGVSLMIAWAVFGFYVGSKWERTNAERRLRFERRKLERCTREVAGE
jgi:hypothetical protein